MIRALTALVLTLAFVGCTAQEKPSTTPASAPAKVRTLETPGLQTPLFVSKVEYMPDGSICVTQSPSAQVLCMKVPAYVIYE